MTVRCNTDLDQNILWSEIFGHRNSVDLVRFVKLVNCFSLECHPDRHELNNTSTTWMAFISSGMFLKSMFDTVFQYNDLQGVDGMVEKQQSESLINGREQYVIMRGRRRLTSASAIAR